MAVSTKSYLAAFESASDARDCAPGDDKGSYKLHQVVAPDGATFWTWSTSGNSAIGQVCKDLGWVATQVNNKANAALEAANARAAAAQAELDKIRARIKAAGLDAELG